MIRETQISTSWTKKKWSKVQHQHHNTMNVPNDIYLKKTGTNDIYLSNFNTILSLLFITCINLILLSFLLNNETLIMSRIM